MGSVPISHLREAHEIAVALAAFDPVYEPIRARMTEELARAEAAAALRFKVARRAR